MKKHVIQIRVNPHDEWKDYKKFKRKDRAEQSLSTLRKHVSNIFKDSEYCKYRLKK